MKRLLLPLLAALALPTAVNAGEKFDITCFWRTEDTKPDINESIDRFIIDTELDKGSLSSYQEEADGKKRFLGEYMVEFINSPMQIEVIYDQGYWILFDTRFGKSYVFLRFSKEVVLTILSNFSLLILNSK